MRVTAPGGVPAVKAAAVYSLDPDREEGGERRGKARLIQPLTPSPGKKGCSTRQGARPAQQLLLLPLTTGLCSSSCPGPSLPAWYFSACLSVCLCHPQRVPVSRPHVPACTCSPVCVSPVAPGRVLLPGMAQVARGCLRIYVHLCFSAQLRSCACLSLRPPSSACLRLCLHLYICLHWPFLSR